VKASGGDREACHPLPILIGSPCIISDADLDLLRLYVEAGGHLVWMARSGMADEEGIVRADVMPGALRMPPVRYGVDKPVAADTGDRRAATPSGTRTASSPKAETIAGYDHPFLLTMRRDDPPVRQGTAHRPGYADRTLSGALARWVAASLTVDPWRAALGATQSHVACRTADGRTLHLIHNWSWQPSRYVLPASVTALGADTALSSDQPIELGAWDVQILLEKGARS
jgi:beta-galactosidase